MAMSFPPELVEDVRARVDIVDVISEHVDLRRSGARYVGLCPFHSERTPSFSVDREKQLYHCFGCQAGGDVFTFVMERTGAPFPEAVEVLAARVGIDTSRFAPSPEQRERRRRRQELLELHRLVADFYVRVLRSAAGRGARAYLQSRRLRPATAERFQLGYAPPADGFLRFLAREGVDETLAKEAGLLGEGRQGRPPYPRFRERLMFPIWDRGGRVIGFGGRLLQERARAPKYLNSPETPLFSKRRTVYGMHLAAAAAKEHGRVIVVEGYTDCLRLWQHGTEHAVASLGTAFTEHQARLLQGLAPSVLVAFDGDAAGEAATMRSLDLLAGTGMDVAVVQLPGGMDPDDFAASRGTAAWQQALVTALPLVEYKITRALAGVPTDTVEGRARAVRAAVAVLRDVRSPVALEGYIDLVAERTGVASSTVAAELHSLAASAGQNLPPRHTPGKIRHNNKGFRGMGNEPTPRGRLRGGERLSYAEHVILRHVLTGNRPATALDAVHDGGTWSTPEAAAAAALLRDRTPEVFPVDEWLGQLPEDAGATLLRRLWADETLAGTPWEDARAVLRQQIGLQRLWRLEHSLREWMESKGLDTAAGALGRLLLEYKILRSDLLEEQGHHTKGGEQR